jgi:hypothetical protein
MLDASLFLSEGDYMFRVYPFEVGCDLQRVVGATVCSSTYLTTREIAHLSRLSDSRARKALNIAVERGILGCYGRTRHYVPRDWEWIDRNIATVERPCSDDWPAWIPPRGYAKQVRL